jgi:hypothetical protein
MRSPVEDAQIEHQHHDDEDVEKNPEDEHAAPVNLELSA